MTCFDRSIQRAIHLRKLGFNTAQIAAMVFSTCGDMGKAHLVARAAKVFVGECPVRVSRGRVEWLH